MLVEEKLQKLGLKLPAAPPPGANYKPFVQAGNLLFIAGQLPMSGGELRFKGKVGQDLTVEEGYKAASLCALNGLAQIKAAVGAFRRIESIVRVDGYVNSAPGFTGQAQVLNGCSDLLNELLGDRAGHARIALGHNELPLDAAVEIAFIVAVYVD